MSLETRRRWCLTGTPVQNKLDDLFSLTEFLRFYPVDNSSNTRKYIMEPLGRKDGGVLADLRSIMAIIALRRTKATCECRKRSERGEMITLTSTERESYNLILSNAKTMLSGSVGSTSSQILLQSILQLRKICSHGTPNIAPHLEKGVKQRSEASICSQCGDLLDVLRPPSGVILRKHGNQLCHDCALGWDNLSPDIASSCLSLSQTNPPVASTPASEQNVCQVSRVTGCDDNDIDMDREESRIRIPQRSSKLEKVLSNLRDLGQASSDDQTPIKRYA